MTEANVAAGRARRIDRAALLTCCALVVPAIVALLAELWWADARVDIGGDWSLIEAGTWAAVRGRQWLGAYSKYGFAHPGPALFYVLAPFYALSGERTAGLYVGAGVVSLACLGAIALVIRRLLPGRPVAQMAFVAVISGWVTTASGAWEGLTPLTEPWNPWFALLPLALCAFAAWAVTEGRWGFLPVLVVAHGVAAQSHVTAVPLASACALMGVGRAWWTDRRIPRPRRGVRWDLVGAGVLFALLWTPVVVEAMREDGGNPRAMLRYALERESPPDAVAPLDELLEAFAQPSAGLLRALGLPLELGGGGLTAVAVILVVALLGAVWSAARRGDRVALSLAVVAVAQTAAASTLLVFLRGHGPERHLFYSTTAAGMLTHLAVLLGALGARPSGWSRGGAWAAGVAAVGVIALGTGAVIERRSTSSAFHLDLARSVAMATEIGRCVSEHGRVQIDLRGRRAIFVGAGVALDLLKRGRAPCIDPRHRNEFGRLFESGDCSGATVLRVGDRVRYLTPVTRVLPYGWIALAPSWTIDLGIPEARAHLGGPWGIDELAGRRTFVPTSGPRAVLRLPASGAQRAWLVARAGEGGARLVLDIGAEPLGAPLVLTTSFDAHELRLVDSDHEIEIGLTVLSPTESSNAALSPSIAVDRVAAVPEDVARCFGP